MTKVNLTPLSGTAERLPGAQLEFERWKSVITDVYASYGFTPIETPILERSEVLAAKVGAATQKQIYQVANGGGDTSLRFDLTVPLARYIAVHQNELAFPFRRQAVGEVFRGERAQLGRFREFCQADADIVGRGSLDVRYDAEVLALAGDVFDRLGIGTWQLQINHRGIIVGFLESLRISDQKAVIQLLDDAEKIGPKKLREELALLRLDAFEIRKITKFAAIAGTFEQFEQQILALDCDHPLVTEGLAQLRTIEETLTVLAAPVANRRYATAIVRGLDYYTGMIFETKLTDYPRLGSVCSGGRYDNLVGNFASTPMPGVGFSIGLTRLFAQAEQAGLVKVGRQTVADMLVIPLSQNWPAIGQVVAALRGGGIRVDVCYAGQSIRKKMAIADKLGVPFVLLLGDEELTSERLTLRQMEDGEQQQLNVRQVIDTLTSSRAESSTNR